MYSLPAHSYMGSQLRSCAKRNSTTTIPITSFLSQSELSNPERIAMNSALINDLVDPVSREALFVAQVGRERYGEIEEGVLSDGSQRTYVVKNFIPRFVGVEDDTAAHWGEQWNHYCRTQIDAFNGTTLSQDRLCKGT